MKLNFSLTEEDFLIFQLHTAFNSAYIKRVRRLNWLGVALLYFILSILLYFLEEPDFSIGFLVLAVLWILIYPFFQRRQYIKSYKKYIREHLKNRFDKPIYLTFDNEYIHSKDESGEGKMKLREIEIINEIQNYYFLKFNAGVSLIIPKSKIDHLDEVKHYLENLIKNYKIKHVIDLNWQWR